MTTAQEIPMCTFSQAGQSNSDDQGSSWGVKTNWVDGQSQPGVPGLGDTVIFAAAALKGKGEVIGKEADIEAKPTQPV
jgi:hypothetical protein